MKIFIYIFVSFVFLCSVPLSAGTPEGNAVKIYFAGDVTFANHFEYYVGDRTGYPFQRLQWFSDADITMVNLESPFTLRGESVEKKFTFRAHPIYIKTLLDGGVDIVTIANNHLYDYSAAGLFDTINYLDSANIKHVGAGADINRARRPVIFNVNDIRMAFLGYYGLGKHSDSYPATETDAGTAMRSLKYIRDDIQKIRPYVDYIIINFHWGSEKQHYPGKAQVAFAHQVIDAGADLIIGHHPHVLQGIESYKNKIIAYSLGNFIFGGNSRKKEKTIVLEIKFDSQNKSDIRANIIPLEVNYWQPLRLKGKMAQAVIDSVEKYSAVFPQSIFDK